MIPTYKSDFRPTMKRWAIILKAILLITDVLFFIRALVAPSFIDQVVSLLLGVGVLAIYVYTLSIIPSSIQLGEKEIIIQRTFGKKCIPYSIIKDAFIYNEVQGDVRYCGSNGFLGYMGIMGSTLYGKYYSYVKNPQQQVFILTKNKNYLISCENRETFIKELHTRMVTER